MAALIPAIDIHRYTLTPRDGSADRQGVLLRARWSNGDTGYGDLHPWTELGEPSLKELLQSLTSETPLRLAARALALAQEDATARREQRSLFHGLEIPRSHASVVHPELLDRAGIEEFQQLGFDTLKMKVSPETLPAVVELVAMLPKTFRLRLDANARFDSSNIAKLLRALEAMQGRVDFVEDPTARGDDWATYSVRGGASWASDWVSSPDPDVVVLKANATAPLTEMQRRDALPDRWVVTTALDHPVGQCFAAWEAARARAKYGDWVDTCGLATHLVYQRNAFSDRLSVRDGRLVVPDGADANGIGFDALWPELSWTSLRCG